MKRFVGLLLLCGAIPSFGQTPKPPDLSLVSDGDMFRFKIVHFSLLVDKTVRNVSHFEAGIILPNCCFASFVPQDHTPVFQRGTILQGLNGNFDSQYGDSNNNPRQFTYIGEPFSGPGKLIDFSAMSYDRYYSGQKKDDMDILNLVVKDPDGFDMKLTTEPLIVHYDSRLFGDINNDKVFNVADVTTMLRSIIGITTFTDAETWYADIAPTSKDGNPMKNGRLLGDGKVDVGDVIQGLRVVTGYWKYWWPDPIL